MSASTPTRYVWTEEHRRYAEYAFKGSHWEFARWMPSGWQPRAAQQSDSLTTSAGSSPAAQHLGKNEDARDEISSDRNSRFPRGEGAAVTGIYSAMLGTQPGNLHYEELDPSYYVRDRRFFTEGKVVSVIFSQTAANNATSYNKCISEVRFMGNHVHTQARRFVIVRLRREFCFACPIFTYSNRATLKEGVNPDEHGIIYSQSRPPQLLHGERGIKKASIEVTMAAGVPDLHIASRIYYGIHHPIQYNVKVKDIGQVLPHHVPVLIGNWKAEDNVTTKQAADVTATGDDPDYPFIPESEDGSHDPIKTSRGKAPVKEHSIGLTGPPSDEDPHLYHPTKNVHGYDIKKNPHMYHPEHNPYGYHPEHNTHGFHPQKNRFSYHPIHNCYGYDPVKAPFCYHPDFSPFGYHAQKNAGGYHPQSAPFGYHPEVNPTGFHPKHNKYGYHPTYNMYAYHQKHLPFGYHPKHFPNSYHPKWNPMGKFYSKSKRDESGEEDKWDEQDTDEDEEDDGAEEEEEEEEQEDDESADSYVIR